MIWKYKFILIVIIFFTTTNASAKEYVISSPDKKISVKIVVEKLITWAISFNGENLLTPSPLSMELSNGNILGKNAEIIDATSNFVNKSITAIVPVKNRVIADVYNELLIKFNGNYSLTFRVYNDGAAYRFQISLPDKFIEVKNETASFNFGGNYSVFWPKEMDPNFQSHYEAVFSDTTLNQINDKTYGYLPLLFTSLKGTRILITEADLHDYPNLFFFGTKNTGITAGFPPVNLEMKPKSDRAEEIIKKASYIAKTSGNRSFPWRICIVTNDKGLLETDMVYKLSTPNVLTKTDWIKPGKAAWDWWNYNNIYGVDFKAGLNTKTYKYYIDFAAEYGLQYIVLDEGWSKETTNIMEPATDIDIKELVRYGQKKNVGIVVWALWGVLNKDVEGILDRYAAWGIKGIKVDFMTRADQDMVNFYEKLARETAKRKMLVDFHGAFKPSGLNRMYPNVIGYEGVKGMEANKWSYLVTPNHDVTLPFTRMVAGTMDYTPGAMINATNEDFRPIFNEPMSQGTRAHQVAMFVVYEAPFQMLADNPSNYRKDAECTKFISLIPTTWDKTVGLNAEVGEYVVIARKNGKNWYIGAMTNWKERAINIQLNFLDGKKYHMKILQDGVNANRHAADYKIISKDVKATDSFKIIMSDGGGWSAILTPLE